ncbi:MAG TPA: serine/threonine protein kinase [Methylibium sp.]|uniref:serine/threonine protein kinase n=1 Tax=Methylibium sp. TaxID=2067992 RepID=UPI002DBE36FB|nr:serine/threonine protein kinase [Methylibium sp.]HEU4457996.1 serine/threonine protein kinase [Methylibium sp.]
MDEPHSDRPYDDLTPHAVLDALADVGLHGDGRLLQLNSYENRVFQVGLDDGRFVVAKFYRPGRWSDAQIVEEHAFALELAAAEVPAVAPQVIEPQAAGVRCLGEPPTLAMHDAGTLRYAVWPRRAGRAPELDDPDTLTWIGRFLGRWHVVGRRRRFEHRRAIDAQQLGHAPRRWLLKHDAITPSERARWAAVSQRALDLVDAAFERAGPLATLRLHGDCHPGNLLWTADGPHFVDLDDAGMGPAVQDFWMLLAGDDESARRQLACLLEGYEQFMDFDRAELALIEPLRTLRMLHHSAWLAQRWNDPAFPVAFPWFGGSAASAYWAEQIELLRWQVVAMGGDVEEATADR